MQADFFLEVTRLLRAEGVHTALDTSGHVTWEKLAPLVGAVDLVLYDIKALDSELHHRQTGVDNRLILENARRIALTGKEMIVRMILVPGANDSEAEISGRLEFAYGLGGSIRVDILGYHRLGAGKYAALGQPDPMEGVPECPDEVAARAAKQAAAIGLSATIGG